METERADRDGNEVDEGGGGNDIGGETGDPDLRLDDLSLPQRVFVAAVQNPSRGVFLVILIGFAFSFFIALWMAFPRIGALVTGIAVVVGLLITAVLALLR